ncbi:MAG: cobalamin-binding protein [Xanthomonadales bacterium]|nr:cobalamin-binding protein [Xanthomonadales bacterium]
MRIVTHTCSNTEIVCALGLGDQIVGTDDHSDYPPEIVRETARIGPDQEIDVERVAALKPDLVITSLTIPGHEQCVARLQQAGLPMLVVEPTRLEHVPRDIRVIADALGVPDRGEALARRFEAALVAAPVASPRPRVLVEWWPKPVIVPGRDSWVTQLLDLAGGINPWSELDAKSGPVEDAEVLAAAPDAVVISWCGVPFEKYRPEVVRRRDAWQGLRAIERDRIYCVTEAWLGRPGPRLIEGLAALKSIVAHCVDETPVQRRFGC